MQTTRVKSRKRQETAFNVLVLFFAVILLVMSYLIIYCMITLAVKPGLEVYTDFWGWPAHPNWRSLTYALGALYRPTLNTILVITITCSFMLLVSMPAAYAFARIKFIGREFFYLAVLALMMIPDVLTLTPRFVMMRDYGLYDTWWALILPWGANGVIWGVIMIRNHIEGLPHELFDSAKIDGCNEWQLITRICLPLSGAIMATVVIIKMVEFYNDFTWPMVVINRTAIQVISVVIRVQHNNVAGCVITCIPLLFLFLCASSLYMEGLTAGAIKG